MLGANFVLLSVLTFFFDISNFYTIVQKISRLLKNSCLSSLT